MRNTRLKKYKKFRQKKNVKLLLFGFILPVMALILTYVLAEIFIIPIFA
ncbi:hypothetical protein [Ruminiclostridium sufflavum]|nr:hypothetical protein [Ruminiclostridium sufflavum]